MLLTLKFSLKSLELICREESTVESFRNCVFSLMYLLCACVSYFSPTISIRMLLYQLWIILVISGAHMQKLYNYGEKKKRLNPILFCIKKMQREKITTIDIRIFSVLLHNHMQSNIFRVDPLKTIRAKFFFNSYYNQVKRTALADFVYGKVKSSKNKNWWIYWLYYLEIPTRNLTTALEIRCLYFKCWYASQQKPTIFQIADKISYRFSKEL